MKFLNVLVATTAVFANSNGYYYSPDVVLDVNVAVIGVVDGLLGLVGAVIGGVTVSASVLAQIKIIARDNCRYGNYYGKDCYRCTRPLGPLRQLNLGVNANVNVDSVVDETVAIQD
ncbi:hypothetical protein CONCODRAFT_13278 [Conidiobolus coronatus NRRL 28638]|uniref:Uncharacterized protein n=1 Tax=Conidiobolus coronatus (strain ATCC 28846 / CBS 209.66 / NRRL 28638) TaxID=796925 RepID=A0A137NR31_CONC2|nr:hypothetical protein CONCODRAFT_13278 [Conidiobolus coronatus NRRL 28638]|eukprot:KXN65219.1 hypothetical protein CONCODRAFT_13278 [Conidiobolus coronatus NRRL 28638]